MPAGFRRHVVGKTLKYICYSTVALLLRIFLNKLGLIECHLNNAVNFRLVIPHIV